MNNAGKAFSSALTSFSFYQGIGFLETLKNPANLFKNNLNNIRNNMKSNKNVGIVELLIPTVFPKKASHEWTKTFLCKKNYGEVVLNWRTNHHIMPRFVRSFKNDKFILQ